MIRQRDPSSMAPAERLAELGEILATGYRRLRLSRERGLAAGAEPEAPCDQAVNGNEAEPAKEVA